MLTSVGNWAAPFGAEIERAISQLEKTTGGDMIYSCYGKWI
jgi:hypothetical protein